MSEDIEKTGQSLINIPSSKLALGELNTALTKAALTKMVLPRMFYQLVIFLVDASASMTWSSPNGIAKSNEVCNAVRDIIARLKKSKNCSSFDMTVWAYANNADQIIPVSAVSDIIDEEMYYDPMQYNKQVNYTKILEALEETGRIAQNYLKQHSEKDCQVLYVVLSDGIIHDHEAAAEFQKKLISDQPRIAFSTSFFAEPEDSTNYDLQQQKLGREILFNMATPGHFTDNISAEEIRKHMIKSISLTSKTDDIL